MLVLTETALVYSVPTVEVGVVTPSVVYRMLAPVVAQLIVTLCVLEYVPAAGVNVGVETGGVIV